MTHALSDRYGRVATDLRLSLTDRCNLRCTYCLPAGPIRWMPRELLLTDDEMVRLARIGVEQAGITKIRLTGGEPLMRPGAVALVRRLARLGVADLAMTTNATQLARFAPALKDAGLRRVNVSLDSVDPERFRRVTRRDRLDDVLAGLEAAARAGLGPVKINTVVAGEDDLAAIPELVRFCLENGYSWRAIEAMPIGPAALRPAPTATEILQVLQAHFTLAPAAAQGASPARTWRVVAPKPGTVGIIGSVSWPFCAACTRTRISAAGRVRSCLFSDREVDLRQLMRAGASDAELLEAWGLAMRAKPAGHSIAAPTFRRPQLTMAQIGG